MLDDSEHLFTLSNHVSACWQLFTRYLDDERTTEKDMVEDQRARLNVWAASIGIFAGVQAPPDTGLKLKPNLRGMAVQLLVVIRMYIEYGTCDHAGR